MKILIISDTHGHIGNALKLIKEIKNLDRIIHLGDLEKDAEDLDHLCRIPIDYVAGNCDYCTNAPYDKVISFYGVKIMLTHGHMYKVKWEERTILREARKRQVDIVLFGHTHVAYHKQHGHITLFNPGSLSLPRDGKRPSYGLLEIAEDGKFQFAAKKMQKSIDLW